MTNKSYGNLVKVNVTKETCSWIRCELDICTSLDKAFRRVYFTGILDYQSKASLNKIRHDVFVFTEVG